MHIVLYQPEIPGNTGSIGRVCVGTATSLHLVGKLGFSLEESAVRRAGLDYWWKVDLHVHADWQALRAALPDARFHFFSARGGVRYDQIAYGPDDALVFGGETRGFPEGFPEGVPAAQQVFLPTNQDIRSLNLANAVTAVLYEALRQQGFAGVVRP